MNSPSTSRFSFWQPVTIEFNEDPNAPTSGEPEIANKLLWSIGSFADQFLSLGQSCLKVEATPIDAKKIYLETQEANDFPKWMTALKVAYYVLSFGALPLIALVIKIIYKNRLNAQRVWNPDVSKGVNYDDTHILSEKMIGKTKIVLAYGSLTDEKTDAIVNAANKGLWAGGGVCGAIYKAAGKVPFDECEQILQNKFPLLKPTILKTDLGDKLIAPSREINCGEAVITTSGKLAPNVKAIVHAAGPDYSIKDEKEHGQDLLASAYRTSLELVCDPNSHPGFATTSSLQTPLRSVTFPSISTGIFGAPLNESAFTALSTIKTFIEKNPNALDEVRIDFLHEKFRKTSVELEKMKETPVYSVKTAPAYMAALNEI